MSNPRRGPSVKDQQARDTFLEGVRLGLPNKDAAARAGWGEATIYQWRTEAENATARGGKLTDRERNVTEFAEAWRKAAADFIVGHLAVITRAAQQGQWQAAAWTLERRIPNEFGRRILEVTGAEGGPIQVEEKLTSVLDLAAKVRAANQHEARQNGAMSNGH